ncbi:MAG: exosortase family protein XrtF [Flavobacteriaceae bacterium]|nr:exosortase family protein XrtF [Flavobacteriaceae bacterium]
MLSLYNLYLNKTQERVLFSCSPITETVAKQAAIVSSFLGYKTTVVQHKEELSYKVLVHNKYIARVIEGCNSISIIILFWAFIIAFSGKISTTIIFGLAGSLLIYTLNVFRISLLAIGLYKYPKQQIIFHDLLFPAIIYGFIVVLWLIWIKKFTYLTKKNV